MTKITSFFESPTGGERERKRRVEAYKEGRGKSPTGQIFSGGKELSADENKGLTREQLGQKSTDEARIYYLLSARKERKLGPQEIKELELLQNKWTSGETTGE